MITATLAALGEVLAPPRCLGCLKELTWLCADCLETLRRYELTCIGCARPRARGLTCRRCQKTTPLTGVISVGAYGNTLLRRGIHWLKFKGVRAVAPILAQLFTPQLTVMAPLSQLQRDAVLVPIPLFWRRELSRGFNQSRDLALALSQLTRIPVWEGLVRARSTWTQTKLTPELRQENMQQAFTITSPLPIGTRFVLLIDDVTTTGSTLSNAARALRPGPYQLWGGTIARG
jgi:ComF family protein